VALIAMVAWLVSSLNTICIKPPPSAHVAMAGCAHGASMADRDIEKAMHTMEKCANKTCYTALASAKDGFSIEKLKLSFDLPWLPLAFLCAFLLVVLRQAPPVARFVDFGLRRRRIPLIYQFCSLLN
jgi:hypothetical protein